MRGLMRKAAAAVAVAGFLATAQLGSAHGFDANQAGNAQFARANRPGVAAVATARTREMPRFHTGIAGNGGVGNVHLGVKFP